MGTGAVVYTVYIGNLFIDMDFNTICMSVCKTSVTVDEKRWF